MRAPLHIGKFKDECDIMISDTYAYLRSITNCKNIMY